MRKLFNLRIILSDGLYRQYRVGHTAVGEGKDTGVLGKHRAYSRAFSGLFTKVTNGRHSCISATGVGRRLSSMRRVIFIPGLMISERCREPMGDCGLRLVSSIGPPTPDRCVGFIIPDNCQPSGRGREISSFTQGNDTVCASVVTYLSICWASGSFTIRLNAMVSC